MPFMDKSDSFTNGFECGMLWLEMTEGNAFDQRLIHESNREQIRLMLDHFGYEYSFKDYDEEWAYLYGRPIDITSLVG